jgi:hypothetical protein
MVRHIESSNEWWQLTEARMPEATYVSFVPKAHSTKLRQTLQMEDTGEVSWRERKTFRGSEFYFSGPPSLARKTHEFVTLWLTRNGG